MKGDPRPTITVAELMAELQRHPAEAEVFVEEFPAQTLRPVNPRFLKICTPRRGRVDLLPARQDNPRLKRSAVVL
jgi:hypothetical protein